MSDCHFGIPDYHSSLAREKKFVAWLDMIKADAAEIYILGDLFDFWFEYKTVIPKGYTRLLGKLAELTDNGIKIHLFTGNHDMWMFRYFEQELGIDISRKPVVKEINGLKILIGHGDGLGPGDYGYKMIKKIFASKTCQWLYARLHPNFAMGLGLFFSRRSRLARGDIDRIYKGDNGERLIVYAKEMLKKEHFDLFIFGHRHLPIDLKIGENSRYINLGDWLQHFSYALLDGKEFITKKY
ncbi:MAG TPA: UDP-2,3-diacylglucosamine diphosphatase [Bacteroidales bacterium]|nr:UDP-2,3-diacylglucosamine diphosphatase [Bacteroidales bacterium]HQN16790.1 UDP-2,3-diacylglucosamine diphosphatase [Bacteroidales bacterium]HQP16384.1 UDP-2,3-diacylglucosamine diphosphatase [Bacteroidales bacterium]